MKNKIIKIELIKNVMIVVLFITTILLLSFFWKGISFDSLKTLNFGENDSEFQPEKADLISPEEIRINFGSEAYALIDASYVNQNDSNNSESDNITMYQTILGIMQNYLSRSEIKVEGIEKSQYDEVMSYTAMTAKFAYNLPFRRFLEENSLTVPAEGDAIDKVSVISVSPVSSGNLFIYDGENDKYYRLCSDDTEFAETMAEKLSSLISSIEENGNTTFYTIKSLAGVENNSLIPLYSDSKYIEYSYEPEFTIESTSDVNRTANMFFNQGLDFVRKITENKGSLLYMYGYSQKVLKLNSDGSIQYTEELDSSLYTETDLYDALSSAIEYVSSHGGWKNLCEKDTVPYLSDARRVTREDGKYQGYIFSFGTKKNGIPLKYSKGSILQVEVYGLQVTNYMREVILLGNMSEVNLESSVEPIEVITNNYAEMYKILNDADADTPATDDAAGNGENTAESASEEAISAEAAGSAEEGVSAGNEANQAEATDEGVGSAESEGDSGEIISEDPIFSESGASGNATEAEFESVMLDVKKIEIAMYRDVNNEDKKIYPAWSIQVRNLLFWFSIDTGEYLGYTTMEGN